MISLRQFLLFAALSAVALGGCDCGGGGGNNDGGTDGSTPDGSVPDAGDGGDGSTPDVEPPDPWEGYVPPEPIPTDPNSPDNETKDTDCDGLTDAQEFSTVYADGLKTNPGLADTDGDRIPDGMELGLTSSPDPTCANTFVPDADPTTKTSPVLADSDGDGIVDGREDLNFNGKVDPGETNPLERDTDGDLLEDGEEDANKNGVKNLAETDPRVRDTDGDGAPDGVEVLYMNTNPLKPDTDGDSCLDAAEDVNMDGTVDTGETDPNNGTDCGAQNATDTDQDGISDDIEDATGTSKTNPDTDGDGIPDGIEDANRDGIVQAGETNPRKIDSDCDGIADGVEDANKNGIVNVGETDPRSYDTDGDGLSDGVERGITSAADPASCPNVPFDTDPATTTDPTKRDTDGDGIDDGAEDTNQNGKVDTGELNPGNPADGTGPAGAVCTTTNLRPVRFDSDTAPDLSLGLPTTFTEVTDVVVGGEVRGMMGWDNTRKVAFLVYRRNAPGANPTADEASIRGQINGVSAVSNVTTQTFSSWDGFNAVEGLYDQASSADIKTRANALANALIGSGAGVLTGTAGTSGAIKLQAQYIHRSNQSLVVLIALTTNSLYSGNALFSMKDVAGGSAVAQFGDTTGVQCETFTPETAQVEFLFSVDDSGSMDDKQNALGSAADQMSAQLANSSLDYRLALVTSTYHRTSGSNSGTIRGWVNATTDPNFHAFKCWLRQNYGSCPSGQSWIGTGGSGQEGVLGAARKAIDDMSASGAAAGIKLRPGATVVTILLGDADDQTKTYTTTSRCYAGGTDAPCEDINNFLRFFQRSGNPLKTTPPPPHDNPTGEPVTVHGIICPDLKADGTPELCGEEHSNPRRNPQVLTATGGIRASVMDTATIPAAMEQIVADAIARTGYKLQKPPIGASIKVAMTNVLNPGSCSAAGTDMPRSRQNGWDFDGKSGTLAFFGACRPTSTSKAAVSYRYWINNSPLPDGSPPPCFDDPYYDGNDPDFCSGNRVCDPNYNQCTCPGNCGGNPPSPGMACNSSIAVCDFTCTADCGGNCGANETCNTDTCGCQCEQSYTCPAGQKFDSAACGCVCDTDALACGPNHAPDANSCSCVCQDNCGGNCGIGSTCNTSTCTCSVVID